MKFIKFIVKKILPPFITDILRLANKFLKLIFRKNASSQNEATIPSENVTANSVELYAKSFGEQNPDKYFYVIRGFGSGMFSNLQYVLACIRQSEMLGMIPVVDFENFRNAYTEPYPIEINMKSLSHNGGG